ncbi:hypothetical protein D3C73_872250 [compost metagenome]
MPLVPWWRNQEGSGGQFIEQTTHIVDLLRFALGDIDEVYAAYANRVMSSQHENVTVDDVGTVTLKLKSGIIANISNTCLLPQGISRTSLAFYTGQGLIDWNPNRLEVVNKEGTTEHTDPRDAYLIENSAFIHAVRTGDTSQILSDYSDAWKTHLVTCAALESARSGLPVRI